MERKILLWICNVMLGARGGHEYCCMRAYACMPARLVVTCVRVCPWSIFARLLRYIFHVRSYRINIYMTKQWIKCVLNTYHHHHHQFGIYMPWHNNASAARTHTSLTHFPVLFFCRQTQLCSRLFWKIENNKRITTSSLEVHKKA